MRNLRILIDLDGVCADFHGRLLELYNRDYNDDVQLESIKGWHLDKEYFPKASRAEIHEYFSVPGFWFGLDPRPKCVETLKFLHEAGHDLVIVTAIPATSELAFYEKSKWVEKHLPFIGYNSVIGATRKELVVGDLLIDDAPHNLKAYKMGFTCAMDAPYNREVASTYRVKTWREVKWVVTEIATRTVMYM